MQLKSLKSLVIASSVLFCATSPGAAAALDLSGRATQGGLLVGQAPDARSVVFEGRALRLAQDGVFLVGFGRDAAPQAELVITHEDGRVEHRVIEVAPREYRIQHIDGLPREKVTPPESVLARIREEGARVAAARAADDPRTDFRDGFVWPLTGRILSLIHI